MELELTHPGSQAEEQLASLLWTEQVRDGVRHQRHKLAQLVVIEDVPALRHLPHGRREEPQRGEQQPQRCQRQEDVYTRDDAVKGYEDELTLATRLLAS